MLENDEFGTNTCASLMSIVRVGVDDRISQVYLSALALLEALILVIKS